MYIFFYAKGEIWKQSGKKNLQTIKTRHGGKTEEIISRGKFKGALPDRASNAIKCITYDKNVHCNIYDCNGMYIGIFLI